MSWPWIVLVAAAIALPLAIYAFLIEPFRVRLTKVEIPIKGLPAGLDGLTICHLSDMHTAGYGRLERNTARILSDLEADLCVMTGDLLNSREGLQALDRMLDSFKPRLGVFAVLGNGDHKGFMTPGKIEDGLSSMKVNLLVNSHHAMIVNGEDVKIIGVDDPFKRRDQFGRATAGMPRGGFRLLLAHSPDILSEVDGYHVDLVLAGHTHGGQVRVPLLGALWLNSSRRIPVCNGYYDSGTLSRLLQRDMSGVRMYVSRGLGASGIAARFACPPEVALITLREKFDVR